jgi:hypothetical protein
MQLAPINDQNIICKGVTRGMVLYRPVGLKEYELIAASNYTAFPPRLPEQPIFYPVLTFEYAEKIARDWNTTTPPYVGYVTRFEIDDAYAGSFEVHQVGGKSHQEFWVPAEELGNFNRHIIGKIAIVATYYGKDYYGQKL